VGQWRIGSDAASADTRAAQFKDIMILVRQRTHLATYERALRHAAIPFVTSGRGGLLETLEAKDLIALLQFLVSPFADLPLAQTLRAPLFACSNDDLACIARTPGATWWSRLQDLAAAAPQTLSPALARAARLLAAWLQRADALPVHDQLDRIYFESDLIRRYRAAVPAAMRDAVTANLQAFMQRALDTDAGRYPSLPRFIHELADLGDAPPEEAPDEGIIGDPGNAVRILTVHGAKGLEAPIVFLIDTAAARRPESAYDVMVAWAPGTPAPQHLSLWTRKAERSREQGILAEAEAVLAAREETNLMYVAITRAKQALIVSGVSGERSDESWYARIRDAAASRADAANPDVTLVLGADLAAAAPRDRVAGEEPLAPAPAGPLNAPLPTGIRRAAVSHRGTRHGSHFHRLLELLTTEPRASEGSRARIRSELGLAEREFGPLWEQAQALVAAPALARFFDPAQFVRASNEVAFAASSGNLYRIDRLVEFDDEIWVLDYKTGDARETVDGRIEEYLAQVGHYRQALQQAFPRLAVRAAIVFADATTLEIEA
jgi:ATP-dependent helicase/nuclease subunit A